MYKNFGRGLGGICRGQTSSAQPAAWAYFVWHSAVSRVAFGRRQVAMPSSDNASGDRGRDAGRGSPAKVVGFGGVEGHWRYLLFLLVQRRLEVGES